MVKGKRRLKVSKHKAKKSEEKQTGYLEINRGK